MIEMMCRDGSVPDELLEQAADYVDRAIGVQTDVLDIDDHRAMVFWGPIDVAKVLKEIDAPEIDDKDMELCKELLQDYEPDIHQAMLEAGHDILKNCLEELIETIRADNKVPEENK